MNKLTFKQYLDSKDQLKKAIELVPVTLQEYEVRKYCALAVGDDDIDRQSISLKPSHKVLVEWRYDNIDNPTPLSIRFVGLTEVDELDQYSTSWSSTKLKKWLMRHTTEHTPSSYAQP